MHWVTDTCSCQMGSADRCNMHWVYRLDPCWTCRGEDQTYILATYCRYGTRNYPAYRVYRIDLGLFHLKSYGRGGKQGFHTPHPPLWSFFSYPLPPLLYIFEKQARGVKMDPHRMHIYFQKHPKGVYFIPHFCFLGRKTPLNMFFRVKNSPFLGYFVNFRPYITFFPKIG